MIESVSGEQKPLRRLPAAEAREGILDAAERRFTVQGFQATRLEDVGSDVGVGRPAVLYHFKTKRVLYAAVLERILLPFLERVRGALLGPGDLRDRVHAAVRVLVRNLAERPEAAVLATRELATDSAELREVTQAFVAPFRTLLEATFEEARRAGAVREDFDLGRFLSLLVGPALYYFTAVPSLLREPLRELVSEPSLAALEADLLGAVDVALGPPPGARR